MNEHEVKKEDEEMNIQEEKETRGKESEKGSKGANGIKEPEGGGRSSDMKIKRERVRQNQRGGGAAQTERFAVTGTRGGEANRKKQQHQKQ